MKKIASCLMVFSEAVSPGGFALSAMPSPGEASINPVQLNVHDTPIAKATGLVWEDRLERARIAGMIGTYQIIALTARPPVMAIVPAPEPA